MYVYVCIYIYIYIYIVPYLQGTAKGFLLRVLVAHPTLHPDDIVNMLFMADATTSHTQLPILERLNMVLAESGQDALPPGALYVPAIVANLIPDYPWVVLKGGEYVP